MVTVITRWEQTQMDAALEWRMWRQLRGAFDFRDMIFVPRLPKMDGYGFRQADTMAQALAVLPDDCLRVFLEPSGEKAVSSIPKYQPIALILGNTARGNAEHAKPGECYAIATPKQTHLYGINAAAIALAYRQGQ